MTNEPLGRLREELCESFSVDRLDEDRWSILTPLLYSDGDGLPVIVERVGGGWRLSDNGYATSHLFFDDFEHTPAREDTLRRVVALQRMDMDDKFVVTCDLDGPPDPYDIGDFLQVLAQIQGVAFATPQIERDTNYTTTMRDAVTSQLADPVFEPNWPLPETAGRRASYSVDLLVGAGAGAVPTFFASTTAHVRSSTLTWVEITERGIPSAAPILAFSETARVSGNDLMAFQDRAGDDAIIAAGPADMRGVLRLLAERGVELLG